MENETPWWTGRNYSHIKVPKALFKNPLYQDISPLAKLLYGFLLDRTSLSYANGYQVSVRDLEIIPAYKLTKKHLMDMLNRLPVGANLGVWIDQGKAYIDHSVRFTNKRQALEYGKAHSQISIWNWKAGEAIAC